MSILIKGMEMPKNCFDCPMGSDGAVCVLLGIGDGYLYHKHDDFDAATERLPSCPLIEVPPHGDLIDRDALTEVFSECHDDWVKHQVEIAPTIIEAEEGET